MCWSQEEKKPCCWGHCHMAPQTLVVWLSLEVVLGAEQHSAPIPGAPSSLVWTESCWDAHAAAGLSLPSITELQQVPHIRGTVAALGVLIPMLSCRSQCDQGPAKVASSPSKAFRQPAFHSLPEAVHWGMYLSHHGKQPWAWDQEPWLS